VLIRYFLRREERLRENLSLTKKIFPTGGWNFITALSVTLPTELLRTALGSNSFLACFTASIIGALLYMPTLLEVPIVGTLFGYSTGITAAGPALSLLLAGPTLSLPSMIVITRIMAWERWCLDHLVVRGSTRGYAYGAIVS
jgi:uncharacterized membrane protein YraQ (UPF0718 family)